MSRPSVLAIIPARAGSKGIPGKNTAIVAGKPLIAYTIEAARAAAGVERVVVSTDGEEIAAVARACGAEVPFLRPPDLARDDTPGRPVWVHAVRWLEEHEGYRPDYTACLQPTAPLRVAEDIDQAITIAEARQADWVIAVTAAHPHPRWMKALDKDGWLRDYEELSLAQTQRQELSEVYAPTGALFLARRDVLLTSDKVYTERTCAYVMPAERCLDIDTPWDLHLAELIIEDHARHENN